MRLTVTIDCDNAAFDGRQGVECADILRLLADRIELFFPVVLNDGNSFTLHDANGNTVGRALLSEARENVAPPIDPEALLHAHVQALDFVDKALRRKA